MHHSIRKLSMVFDREEIRTRQNYGSFVLVTKWSLHRPFLMIDARGPWQGSRNDCYVLPTPGRSFVAIAVEFHFYGFCFFKPRAEATPGSLFIRPRNAGWFLWMLFLNFVERDSLVPYVILNCQVVMGLAMAWGFLNCPCSGGDISFSCTLYYTLYDFGIVCETIGNAWLGTYFKWNIESTEHVYKVIGVFCICFRAFLVNLESVWIEIENEDMMYENFRFNRLYFLFHIVYLLHYTHSHSITIISSI